jgi:uroporphyrinogen-III synthase
VTARLDGLTVVVTRPAQQAGALLARLQQSGARCIACPTLQIERLAPAANVLERLRARRWDWAVFTSVNAVVHGLGQLPPDFAARCAAIGRATAAALVRHGLPVAAQPEGATSESLLGLPLFSDLAGRGVLLVKGSGGRGLLRDALTARGAEVLEFDVYRRTAVAPSTTAATALAEALADDRRTLVVTVTSVEVLQSLLAHAGADIAPALRRRTLLVPGPRVAAAAAALGWSGPIVQAATAEDDAMAAALARLSG